MTALSNKSIILRPFTLTDAKEHLMGEDEEQIKWVSGGKGTLEGVEDWIKKNQTYWENNGSVFNFAIVDSTNNKLVGFVEANSDFENLEQIEKGEVNISYGLYPSARGRGYVTKLLLLLLEFLKKRGFDKAVLAIDPANEESLKVPARVGFIEKGNITTKKGESLIIFKKNL